MSLVMITPEDSNHPRVLALCQRIVNALQPQPTDPPRREPLGDRAYAMLALTGVLAVVLAEIEQHKPGAGALALATTHRCLDQYYRAQEAEL